MWALQWPVPYLFSLTSPCCCCACCPFKPSCYLTSGEKRECKLERTTLLMLPCVFACPPACGIYCCIAAGKTSLASSGTQACSLCSLTAGLLSSVLRQLEQMTLRQCGAMTWHFCHEPDCHRHAKVLWVWLSSCPVQAIMSSSPSQLQCYV